MTEHRVIVLQMWIGVVTCVVVYATLRYVVSANSALGLTAAFALVPQTVLMERAILTETFELFLIAVGMLGLAATVKSERRNLRAIAVVVMAVSFGEAVAVHGASALALAATVVVGVVVWWIRDIQQVRHHVLHYVSRLVITALVGILAVWPCLPTITLNKDAYGVSSLSPIANPTLVFRWAPLIPCRPPAKSVTLTRALIAEACTVRTFTAVPGDNLDPVFSKTTAQLIATYKHQFATASQQLGVIAKRALMHHPGKVLSELVRSAIWQILHQRASFWLDRATVFINYEVPRYRVYPNWNQWFGAKSPSSTSPFPTQLHSLADRTITLPNQLLGLAALVALLLLLTRLALFASWFRHKYQLSVPTSSRYFLLVAVGQLTGLVVAVGLLSAPDPRYWIPFLPTVFVLLASLQIRVVPKLHATESALSPSS